MNWTLILIGFSLALLMGAGLASLLAQLRPQWSPRRRALTAASALPAATIIAVVIALLWIRTLPEPPGGNMRDLATAAVLTIGGLFALLGFVAGLAGAAIVQRRLGK
ncbi:MAG: hypothetical protein ABIO80_00735 [Sphingomicrobium sp.]